LVLWLVLQLGLELGTDKLLNFLENNVHNSHN
jgi:hypothetical protein